MEIVNTEIQDLVLIKPKVFEDKRGYFMESFKKDFFINNFSEINFIQDNESKSEYGVLRGLHFQNPPYDQTKLVRVIKGKVLDVAVDLRKGSKTFGIHKSFILSEENKNQLLVPKGFAHGFVVLSREAIFHYKVDNIYMPSYDSGLIFNDNSLNIDWKIPNNELVVSDKDLKLKTLKQLNSPFKIDL